MCGIQQMPEKTLKALNAMLEDALQDTTLTPVQSDGTRLLLINVEAELHKRNIEVARRNFQRLQKANKAS